MCSCRQSAAWGLVSGSSQHRLSVRQGGMPSTQKARSSVCGSAESGSIGSPQQLGRRRRTILDFRMFLSRCPLSRSAALGTTSAQSPATSMDGALIGCQRNVGGRSVVKLLEQPGLTQDVGACNQSFKSFTAVLDCRHFLWFACAGTSSQFSRSAVWNV